MSNTYRKQSRRFDDDTQSGRNGKHHHVNNRRHGGIPIINQYDDWTEEDFDELTSGFLNQLDEEENS